MPGREVVGFAALDPGEHRGRRTPYGEKISHRGTKVVLGFPIQQIGRLARGGWLRHRGRSFHGTSLSTRISGGSPSTRSAMMLRRISEVPPSMELPRARR